MKTAIFIHRSVGHNLIHDVELYYDHNTDTLTYAPGEQKKMGYVFPGKNTTPKDYAELFSENVDSEFKQIQAWALRYDVVILKSCYPNSNIKSDKELQPIQNYYKQISEFFNKKPNKQLILLTTPPLTPLMTKVASAKRARILANWLTNTNFGNNIHVFNFFDMLATPQDKRQANMLRKSYRRLLPFNSHPNQKASREIAPKLVSFLSLL